MLTKNGSNWGQIATQSIYIEEAAGSHAGKIKTFDTDGFTITWTKGGSPTGAASVFYLCLR
jgi:hypothetical protein